MRLLLAYTVRARETEKGPQRTPRNAERYNSMVLRDKPVLETVVPSGRALAMVRDC